MIPLHFLVLFMGTIVLFQLTFIFTYSTFSKISESKRTLKCVFGSILKNQLILLFSLFLLLFMGLTTPLVLFMSHTVLFQLIFTFIYSTFSKKFSVSSKYADFKQNLRHDETSFIQTENHYIITVFFVY